MNVSFSNKYFDCVIENKRFRIVESSIKPTRSHAAIVTLEKIDFILKNKLTYEPSFNDNFSKYTQDQLYNILKEKAVHIKKGFQEKEAKQGLPIKNEPKVNSILTRIENSLNPPSVLPLHNDVTHEIATHLELPI